MPRSLCRSCHSRSSGASTVPTSPLSPDAAAAAAALSLAAPVLSLARVLSSLASVLSPTFMPGETDSLSPSPEAAVSLLLRARGAASPKPPRRTLRRRCALSPGAVCFSLLSFRLLFYGVINELGDTSTDIGGHFPSLPSTDP